MDTLKTSLAKQRIFFVIGSTGSGKSYTSLILAHQLREQYGYEEVVIINCDVMQFYDDLPVATNKLSTDDMGGVPHAFIGFLRYDGTCIRDPERSASDSAPILVSDMVANVGIQHEDIGFNIHVYTERVTAFIDNFFARYPNGAVIVCGGTCYYAQAILFENMLVEEESTDQLLFNRDTPNSNLWSTLNGIDSTLASRYHPNDTRRLRRLLSIYESTGKIPSDIFAERAPKLRYAPERCFILWTAVERDALNVLLGNRVDEMMKNGLLREVQEFYRKTANTQFLGSLSEAIGFKEFYEVLSTSKTFSPDDVAVKEAVERVKSNTRRYARQQVRWISNRFVPLLSTVPEIHSHFVSLSVVTKSQLEFDLHAVVDFFMGGAAPQLDCVNFPLNVVPKLVEPVSQQNCQICDIIVYGRSQMEVHLRSKRHLGALRRRRLEQEQKEKYGRILPPSKRQKRENL